MALIDEVTLWTKDEDNANIVTPNTGTSGTIVGTINHESAKFNNGSVAGNGSSGFRYNRLAVCPNANRYVMDFWVKWKVNSGAWGASSEFLLGDRRFGSYHGITFGVSPTFGIQWIMTVKDAGGDNAYYSPVISFSAGQLQHVMIVIDNTASFDGLKTWAVYIDGVQLFSGTNAFNFTVLNPDYGFQGAIVPPVSFAVSFTKGVIDNPKVYNSNGIALKQDILDNRNTEGFPIAAVTKNYYFNSEIVKSKSLSAPIIKDGYFNSDIVKSGSLSTPILKEANFNSEIVKSMDLDTPIE